MGETSDDSNRCRWPDCDCYSPIGPQTCRKAAPVTPMTETPETNEGRISAIAWQLAVEAELHASLGSTTRRMAKDFEETLSGMVPASALEAAQARQEVERTPPMTDLKALLAETTPVAWKYRWKIDGEFVNWRYSDASNAHPSLDGFEEIPLYDRAAAVSVIGAISRAIRALMEKPNANG